MEHDVPLHPVVTVAQPETNLSELEDQQSKQRYTYLQALFLKALREGEKDTEGGDGGERKFGPVPLGIDPNSLLGKRSVVSDMGQGPSTHPLLARSQQFSGIHPKLTAVPAENPDARALYPELRLRNQQRLQQSKRKVAVLKR